MNTAAPPTATELTVAAWPGTVPRLLRLSADREDYLEYVRAGGYQPLDDPDGLLDEIDRSGLLGRGGAAFPLAVKLRTVRDAGGRAGTPSSSPMAKRANRRRSRTSGCCATDRTWSSTECVWPQASSAPNAPTCTCRTRRLRAPSTRRSIRGPPRDPTRS